jgi:6-pyruvoyl-tetrahydropterin synthase
VRATLVVRLAFEAAHRLPALGGKCANLHGHSWTATARLVGPMGEDGIVADLGEVKARLRGWVDTHLDHACLLGVDDPLVKALDAEGCRLYLFGESDGYVPDLRWPTTEATALLLHRMAGAVLARDFGHLAVLSLGVTEAPSIAAEYP